ncbi:MAG: DUF4365 domain-containing protein [Pseudomonadota bacterium]
MARRGKIVPKSKESEWKGLDRIGAMVHQMRCIWREQEKDDIGIDGEIELCLPRDDGDGMYGTGKILKVQAKSGGRYVVRNKETSFSSPVEEVDLRYWNDLNVPALYIVYHPGDDCLYWKHVQGFIEETPDALKAPFRIDFDKTKDVFDEPAFAQLSALCELAPTRVVTDRGEMLYSNVLPVLQMPDTVWVTPVVPEKQPSFHQRLSGANWIPPYFYASGILTTLIDPETPGTAFEGFIDEGGIEQFDLDDWLGHDTDNDYRLRALLNSTLHRHLRHLGLSFLKSHRRYFFSDGLDEETPLRRKWRNTRTGKTPTRIVSKYHVYGKNKFYRHLAFDARFDRFGDRWGIVIDPKVHFSFDGYKRWEGKTARSYAIRARSDEWNNHYLNNILFWADQLSKGKDTFDLTIGDELICVASGVPLQVETTFSIETVAPPDRKVKAG